MAACLDPVLARAAANLYNKNARFVNTYPRKIAYTPPPKRTTVDGKERDPLTQRRLVLFGDSGFGSLADSRSVEGAVTVLADVTHRDGIIQRRGYLIGRRCAKIQRVRKSSMAVEAHAALAAADQAMRFQVSLAEIVTGKYGIAAISPPAVYPIPDPFGPSPTGQNKSGRASITTASESTDSVRKMRYLPDYSESTQFYNGRKRRLEATEGRAETDHIFRPLLLTGCCSLFSAILRIQPLSQGKCAKLVMNQLRDLQTLIDISFVGNSCNLGDMETNHAGSLNVLTQFFAAGEFLISFLGRKARKALDQPHPH